MNESPLAYFEQLLSNTDTLNTRVSRFVSEGIQNYSSVKEEDYRKGTFKAWKIFYDEKSDDAVEAYGYIRFTDEFYPELTLETQKAINSINNNIHEFFLTDKNPEPYLKYIESSLLKFLETAQKSYPHFPSLAFKIEEILTIVENIISTHYPLKEVSSLRESIKEEKSDNTDLLIVVDNNITDIASAVLPYLKGKNDQQEQILSEEDYQYVLEKVREYINTNEIPEIDRKITVGNISKNLLQFTFWVLHKHLYTTRPIRENFLCLIKSLFTDFDDWEWETFRKKFGSKNKVTYKGVKFIPDIIKQELATD